MKDKWRIAFFVLLAFTAGIIFGQLGGGVVSAQQGGIVKVQLDTSNCDAVAVEFVGSLGWTDVNSRIHVSRPGIVIPYLDREKPFLQGLANICD